MTRRQYKLQLSVSQWLGLYWPAIALTLVPLLLLLDGGGNVSVDRGFFAFFILAAAYWWNALRLPHRIEVLPTTQLQFVSPLGQQVISVRDIVSIRPAAFNIFLPTVGLLSLQHRSGTIRFINQFSDMRLLLGEIQDSNPGVQLTGC